MLCKLSEKYIRLSARFADEIKKKGFVCGTGEMKSAIDDRNKDRRDFTKFRKNIRICNP